jgi:hypothetical protein
VVESNGLLNRRRGITATAGSNPALSAILLSCNGLRLRKSFLSFFALQVPQAYFEYDEVFRAVWVACHFLALGVAHSLQWYFRCQMMFGRNHLSLCE